VRATKKRKQHRRKKKKRKKILGKKKIKMGLNVAGLNNKNTQFWDIIKE